MGRHSAEPSGDIAPGSASISDPGLPGAPEAPVAPGVPGAPPEAPPQPAVEPSPDPSPVPDPSPEPDPTRTDPEPGIDGDRASSELQADALILDEDDARP